MIGGLETTLKTELYIGVHPDKENLNLGSSFLSWVLLNFRISTVSNMMTGNIDLPNKCLISKNVDYLKTTSDRKQMKRDNMLILTDRPLSPPPVNDGLKRSKSKWKSRRNNRFKNVQPRYPFLNEEKEVLRKDYHTKVVGRYLDAKKERFSAQSQFFDFSTDFREHFTQMFSHVAGAYDLQKIVLMFENIYHTFTIIRGAVTIPDNKLRRNTIISIVLKEITCYTGKSSIATILEYLRTLDFPFTTQSGEANFDSFFDQVKGGWEKLRASPLCQMLYNLFGLCMTTGLCSLSNLPFNIGAMKIFNSVAMPKFESLSDILDASLGIIESFVRTGYKCFTRRSLMPLFVREDFLSFEERMRLIGAQLSEYMVGSLEQTYDISEEKLGDDIEDLIRDITAKHAKSQGPMARLLDTKLNLLAKQQLTYKRFRRSGRSRVKPYTICFYGPPGTGKTVLVNQMAPIGMHAIGEEYDKDKHFLRCNPEDKFESMANNRIKVCLIDDIGNAAKPANDPISYFRDLSNNACFPIAQADIENKRGIELAPFLLFVTTNIEDMSASILSNEPASIERRPEMWVEMTPLPEYSDVGCAQLNGDKILLNYKGPDTNFKALCTYTVYKKIVKVNETKGAHRTEKVVLLRNASYAEFLQFYIKDIQQHMKRQRKLLSELENVDKEPLCVCHMPMHLCTCPKDEMEHQAKFSLDFDTISLMKVLHTMDLTGFGCSIRDVSRLVPSRLPPLVPPFITNFVNRRVIRGRLNLYFTYLFFKYIRYFFLVCIASFICMPCFGVQFAILPVYFLVPFGIHIVNTTRIAEKEIASRHLTTSDWKTWYIDNFVPSVMWLGLFSTLRVIARLIPNIRFIRNSSQMGVYSTEVNSAPQTQDDLDCLNSLPRFTPGDDKTKWQMPHIRPIPPPERQTTATAEQLTRMVETNLYLAVGTAKNGQFGRVNSLFITTSIAVLPLHFINNLDLSQTIKFYKEFPDSKGNNKNRVFRNFVSRERVVEIPGTDLCLVWIPNSGSMKDLTNYVTENFLSSEQLVNYVYLHPSDCSPRLEKVLATPSKVSHTSMSFFGFLTQHKEPTVDGMCCATLVANSKLPRIIGFHLGGKSDGAACSGRISAGEIRDAIAKFTSRPGVLPGGSEGIFRNQRETGNVIDVPAVDPRSAACFNKQKFEIFGSTTARIVGRSSVVTTKISKDVEECLGVPNKWGPPAMGSGNKPYDVNLEKVSNGSDGFPPDALQWASSDILEDIIAHVDKLPSLKEETRPWTVRESLCGLEGKRFADALAMKTAAGIGLGKKKKDHVIDVYNDDGTFSHRDPTELLQKEIDHCFDCWSRGERSDATFMSLLKDEPVEVTSKKVRVFQSGPFGHCVAVRMLVGPIVRLIRMLGSTSETAVGIDPTSPYWDALIKNYALKFGAERCVAGDYSGYDKRLPADVLSASWWVIYQIAKHVGYTEVELDLIRSASSDTIYSYQIFDSVLTRFVGSEPSGEPFTVDIDTMCGVILFRCAYFTYCAEHRIKLEKFKNNVALVQNGDDHIGTVSKKLPDFDMYYISKYLTRHGMKYTPPDKSDAFDTPFLNGLETTFLKRTTIKLPELPFCVGRLDPNSIFKSLHCRIPGDSTPDEHASQVLGSALNEAMFHGEEYYEKMRTGAQEIASRHDLASAVPNLRLSHKEILELHLAKHSPKESKSVAPSVPLGDEAKEDVPCTVYHDRMGMLSTPEIGGFTEQANWFFNQGLPPHKTTNKWRCLSLLAILCISSLTETMKETTLPAPVEEVPVSISPLGTDANLNVFYSEEESSWRHEREKGKSVAFLNGALNDITLGSFVQRPVRIATLEWQVGIPLEFSINPWQAYFSNPAVADKIKNFFRIQCGMRLRINIVGNQFNFGRLLAAVQPFVTDNGQNTNQISPWPGVSDPLFVPGVADQTLLSQLPHIYLDPVNNAGGIIDFPYLWYKNYWEVTQQEWIRAGSLIITTLSDLQAANGSTDAVTLQIIASPIDFHMDLPTEYEPQMGLSDFDPSHPISSGLGLASDVAGAVSGWKGKKKNRKAKRIASGAKSAQAALRAGQKIARDFGFTRQPNAMGTNSFVPRYANNFALTEGTSEAVPLGLYPDSQVTISPDRFGVGNNDDLVITSIASRESYFNKFTWNLLTAPGTDIFATEVTPAIWHQDPGRGLHAMTPACFACMPFEFWSGTIVFRFQVVCSSFHKGILLIKYDPDAQGVTNNLNLQTIASIDVSKDRDVTVEIGMSQNVPWLYHRNMFEPANLENCGGYAPRYGPAGSISNPYINNGTGIGSIPSVGDSFVLDWKERSIMNGVLSVQVFNQLVAPAGTTSGSIDILCHMSAGEDFKVACPTDSYLRDMTFFPIAPAALSGTTTEVFVEQMQCFNDPVSADDGAPESQSIMHHFGASLDDAGQSPHQYMGEEVHSLRVLLNRKCYHSVITSGIAIPNRYIADAIADFPDYLGNRFPGLTGAPVNNLRANMTYLNYVTPAFALRSGSIANTYVFYSTTDKDLPFMPVTVSRCEKGQTAEKVSSAPDLAPTTDSFVFNGNPRRGFSSGSSGMMVSISRFNPVLDVICPWYENQNGVPAQMSAVGEGNQFTRCHRVEYLSQNISIFANRYVCAGPDYSLGMFLQCPPVYQMQF